MTCAIEDYALIGDCETAALVGRNGRSTGSLAPQDMREFTTGELARRRRTTAQA